MAVAGETGIMQFCDRPDDFRMQVRAIIDDHGGTVDGYYGPGIQVVMPGNANRCAAMQLALQELGGKIQRGSGYRFPACNGEPDHQLCWSRESDRGIRGMAYVYYLTFNFTMAG